jgi:TIR domain
MSSGQFKYFFSYARKDSALVLRLATELRARGVDIWLDQFDILGGQDWDRAIEEALAVCEGIIIGLSPEALGSRNVRDEFSYALEEGKRVVPILLRPCEIPFRLRRLQHVDFTRGYEVGLNKLLRALGIEKPAVRRDAAAGQTSTTQNTTIASRDLRQSTKSHETKRSDIAQTTRPQLRLIAPRERLKASILGYMAGIAWTLAVLSIGPPVRAVGFLILPIILGIPWAISGAITGIRWRIFLSIMGMLIGGFLWQLNSDPGPKANWLAALFGVPLGVMLGPLIGLGLKKIIEWG